MAYTTVLSFDTGFSRNYNRYPCGTYDQLFDDSLLFPHSFIDPRREMKELVLGITHEGLSRAYPYGGMGERAVINDDVNGRQIVVVWDEPSQLAIAFDRVLGDRTLGFELVEPTGFPSVSGSHQPQDHEWGPRGEGFLTAARVAFWGHRFVSGFPYFLSLYLGAAGLATAFVGTRRGQGPIGRIVALAVLGLLVCLGPVARLDCVPKRSLHSPSACIESRQRFRSARSRATCGPPARREMPRHSPPPQDSRTLAGRQSRE